MADALPGSLSSQGHGHGADYDGFTGAGLTREYVQPLAEFHICFLNQGQIPYMQFQQHLAPPIPMANQS